MCPVDWIMGVAIGYIKSHPEEFEGKTYLDGIVAAKELFMNAGHYDYNDVEEWTDAERLEEALCWF